MDGNTKLYVSRGGGGKATVSLAQVAAVVDDTIVLSAPTVSVRGGVLLGSGITASASTIANPAPAGGTGTAAGGWDTAGNRDTAITTINDTRTLALELQTKVNALISSLVASGTIAG